MTELTYGPIMRVGVDLSKRFYQVHAVDQWGHQVLAKSLSPERFYAWYVTLPQGCLVVPRPVAARTMWPGNCGRWAWMHG